VKLKGLFERPFRTISGLGNRNCDPTQAYGNSLGPTPAKGSSKLELWLE